MIYSVIAMVALLAVGSLAVDLGRVQLAKTEMQCAVDAAARAATAYLPSDTAGARAAAIDVASKHTVDGQSLVLQNTDVVFGKWDTATKTLDTASASPDAAQVTGYRTNARGTSINLTIAKSLGFSSFDLHCSETAMGSPGSSNYGILGLNSLTLSSSSTGTYNSSTAAYTTGASSTGGSVASNATISLTGTVSVGGTIYYNTASAPSGGTYFAAKTKLPGTISTPSTPDALTYLISNSNSLLGLPTTNATVYYNSSGTITAPGGNYVLIGATIIGVSIQFTGPATVWMYGPLSLTNADFLAYQNKPSNLQIKFCTATTMTQSTGSDVFGVITAPTTTVSLSGTCRIVGSVCAKTLSASSSSYIYYDSQLGTNGLVAGGPSSVVR